MNSFSVKRTEFLFYLSIFHSASPICYNPYALPLIIHLLLHLRFKSRGKVVQEIEKRMFADLLCLTIQPNGLTLYL